MATLKDVIQELHEFREENKAEHEQTKQKQDVTNSNVTNLQLWRARIEGAGWIVKQQWLVLVAIGTIAGGSVGIIIKFG